MYGLNWGMVQVWGRIKGSKNFNKLLLFKRMTPFFKPYFIKDNTLKSINMTSITVCLEVSCLLRFTPVTNSIAHTSQLRDDGLILCWRRIRIFVIQPATENRQRFKSQGPL